MDDLLPKYRKDYRHPAYLVDTIDLFVDLGEEITTVTSIQKIRRNPEDRDLPATPLVLDGADMELLSVMIDEKAVPVSEYELLGESLIIPEVPQRFTLEVTTSLRPQNNTALEGLYKSNGIFCTQCEAEGFRRITFFPDRPDVMSLFTCTITADREKYPVLLSNGNLAASEDLQDGRHRVRWEDPFPKPCYLFALVAGDLIAVCDEYQTISGKKVELRIYAEPVNADKCDHAMTALKKSMQWDEQVYGREYDLDIYMVVAVNDFNMGAMENKGLNIFNAKNILTSPKTASDDDYLNVERVIAHEYFHNWTGNRVTLRDWFQLNVKEALTVFREQQFSTEVTSGPIKRIEDVDHLRSYQFQEDAGPMAHPIRPESYIEMNNFYTHTIYWKGAEVIRMIHTLLGPEKFRKAMDLYFDRHDGQAVTVEDFLSAMEDGGETDLSHFKLWYSQAGTPAVQMRRQFDPQNRTLTLFFEQQCPDTPGQKKKKPMHIPVQIGLINASGREIPIQLEGEEAPQGETRLLNLKEAKQSFHMINVSAEVDNPPIPSVFRDFSAPVKFEPDYTPSELAVLFAHDTDPFNRWDAGQRLFSSVLIHLVDAYRECRPLDLDPAVVEAFKTALLDEKSDKSAIAHALSLPSEDTIGEIMFDQGNPVDVDAIHHVRQSVLRTIAEHLEADLYKIYHQNNDTTRYRPDRDAIAKRRLKNRVLGYIGRLETDESIRLVYQQFSDAENMTDVIEALRILANLEDEKSEQALNEFYEHWKNDALTLDKWFSVQATSQLPGTLDTVKRLLNHPAFSIKNPNKVRSLIGGFCTANPVHFHQLSGDGYEFLYDQVIRLNAINPQIASRMVSAFNRWRKFDDTRQQLMKAQLEKILSEPELSKDVYEIVYKALA